MIKNILFDFDGTLVNTNDVIIASWQHTYKTYLGHEVEVEHITSSFGEPLMKTLEREFPEIPTEESAKVYREFQIAHADGMVKIFPGIVEMLKGLKAKGYRMGIVTSRTGVSALNYMNMLGIAEYFEAMVTCEDTTIHKPNPEPLLLGLKKMNIEAEESVMVGDSAFDIKCANNAGVKSVLVKWSITEVEKSVVDGAVADYHISEPEELINILEQM